MVDYFEGAWDEALRLADEFIADSEAGRPHTQEMVARTYRARIRYARGDVEGAVHDIERGIGVGRRSGEPQSLIPPLGLGAWLAVRTGRRDEAERWVDEVLEPNMRAPDQMPLELALAVRELVRPDDLERILGAMSATRWKDLFGMIASGRDGDAAEVADEMGVLPHAAFLRLYAAEASVGKGDAAEARAPRKGASVLAVRRRDALHERG